MSKWREEIDVQQKLNRKYEKLYTAIYEDVESASAEIAQYIADLIRKKEEKGEKCVLGLATGSSPIGVYNELVRMHKEEGLTFKNVVTFNLDEYYPMEAGHIQSYVHFMHEHLFNHIDILPENVNIPDGTIAQEDSYAFCQEYEQKIKSMGGLDLQVLGIGRSGHIGFNEPGSGLNSPTRLISLDTITIADAAGDFGAVENVPRRALTMGIETIMSARDVVFMAWGEKKASILKQTVEGDITDLVPATYLQKHPNVKVYLDSAAAAKLIRINTPWLVRDIEWNDKMIKKAVIWLCGKLDKPILKLTNQDYNDNSLSSIVANHGAAYDINLKVFKMLQKSITGWPGGKPESVDSGKPERAMPYPKKVLVFSPRPADDVIAMGGTLKRLIQQGHNVHVAYQTSGNIAVSDDEVLKFLDVVKDFSPLSKTVQAKYQLIRDFLSGKGVGDVDNREVRSIKTIIRKGEAISACRFLGIPEVNVHFLEMPFYETGMINKASLTHKDIELTVEVLRRLQPTQVYAAGDLTDPHGTRRKCLNALTRSLDIVKEDDWYSDCWTWLYKGAWQEWDISDVDMAIPISPEELITKRLSIFKHSTQKDMLYPGVEDMEVWRFSENRNRATAQMLDKLGMAEYEAVEMFVKY
jgi:glucosamine-6-phosphate deaminase